MKRSSLFFMKLILAAFFLVMFSSYSLAEPIYATQEPVEIYHPFYAGGFGGFIVPDNLVVHGGTDFQLDDSWTLGAKAGYILPFKWLAAELEYAYLADHDIDEPGTGYFRAHNLMGNLLFRYPLGMIRPYIGAGIGWSRSELDSSIWGDEDANAFGWQGLAGINLEIIPNLSVDFGYRYFSSKYGLDHADTEIRDHIISVGFNYHFGGKAPAPPPPPPPPEPTKKKCPDTPSCCIVDHEGCPIDSDKDGVCDGCDKCPDTPECCVVDENGCPKDSDKDGVCDGCDKCPDTPTCCVVDENGCPKDSDKDGVCDGCDKCPDTPEIAKVDKDGCPYMAIIRLTVQFDYDKAVVKPQYYANIKELADFLKKYPNLNATIEGHTCNIASAEYNLKLSQRRADAVKKVLIERENIDPKRLKSIGYGLTKPIASNDTEEGRVKNRRVQALLEAMELKK